VVLDGKVVGGTGTVFAISPVAGQANPAGVVKSPPQYFDEAFTITLKDPPPAVGLLHLNVGPINPNPAEGGVELGELDGDGDVERPNVQRVWGQRYAHAAEAAGRVGDRCRSWSPRRGTCQARSAARPSRRRLRRDR
jgi:hypothetical protein